MISNFMCEGCIHEAVCKKKKILAKFHGNAKVDLGVDLTMDDCVDFITSEGEDNRKDTAKT